MKSANGKICAVLSLVLIISAVLPQPASALPLVAGLAVVKDLILVVGGAHVLVSLLVQAGLISSSLGASILIKLGYDGLVLVVASPVPWWSNPYAIGGVVACTAIVAATLCYYMRSISHGQLRTAVKLGYDRCILTMSQYYRALAVLGE